MRSQKETGGAWTRYILINLTMVIISQPPRASKYHAVYFKYISYYFVSHISIKLEKENNIQRTPKRMVLPEKVKILRATGCLQNLVRYS